MESLGQPWWQKLSVPYNRPGPDYYIRAAWQDTQDGRQCPQVEAAGTLGRKHKQLSHYNKYDK